MCVKESVCLCVCVCVYVYVCSYVMCAVERHSFPGVHCRGVCT